MGKLKDIKENKVLKVIFNILYAILTIIIVALLIVVIMQRVTDNEITIGGIRIFNVVTESMIPKYEVGDILLSIEVDTDEIEVGDDIVYEGKESSYADKIITHQVVEIEEDEEGNRIFHTKGIANDLEDPLVYEDQIYGKVIYKIRSLSYISKLMNNVYSMYFFIFIPIAILIFIQIKNFAFDKDEEDEEDEEAEKIEEKNKKSKKNKKHEDEDNEEIEQNEGKNKKNKKHQKEKAEVEEETKKEDKDEQNDKIKENAKIDKEKKTKRKIKDMK